MNQDRADSAMPSSGGRRNEGGIDEGSEKWQEVALDGLV